MRARHDQPSGPKHRRVYLWTPQEDDDFADLIAEGVPTAVAAKVLGKTPQQGRDRFKVFCRRLGEQAT